MAMTNFFFTIYDDLFIYMQELRAYQADIATVLRNGNSLLQLSLPIYCILFALLSRNHNLIGLSPGASYHSCSVSAINIKFLEVSTCKCHKTLISRSRINNQSCRFCHIFSWLAHLSMFESCRLLFYTSSNWTCPWRYSWSRRYCWLLIWWFDIFLMLLGWHCFFPLMWISWLQSSGRHENGWNVKPPVAGWPSNSYRYLFFLFHLIWIPNLCR